MSFVDFVGWHWLLAFASLTLAGIVVCWRSAPVASLMVSGTSIGLFVVAFGIDWLAIKVLESQALADKSYAESHNLQLRSDAQEFLDRLSDLSSASLKFDDIGGEYFLTYQDSLRGKNYQWAIEKLEPCWANMLSHHRKALSVYPMWDYTFEEIQSLACIDVDSGENS